MKAGIITIGDEILLGLTLDSNSNWIAGKLTKLGIDVNEIVTIADKRERMLECLERITKENKLVIITGGLGPTNDDITVETIAEFTGNELVFREDVLDNIRSLFENWEKELIEANKRQAYMPENAEVLVNKKGTAAGMWIDYKGCTIVSLPGVPVEMKAMFEDQVRKRINERVELPNIVYRQANVASIPESILSLKLENFEKELPPHIKLAYLPNTGIVKLRLTAGGGDKNTLDQELNLQLDKLKEVIGKHIYGYENETLAGKLGLLLINENKTLATSESCTGGYIAHEITSVAGSSAYFIGSIVAYSNEIKLKILKVKKETLDEFGAVSEQTVDEMLKGLLKITGADLGIAVSGIAGPTGGTKAKPVGTVCISVGSETKQFTGRYQLTKDRMLNIQLSSTIAMENLRRFLKENS